MGGGIAKLDSLGQSNGENIKILEPKYCILSSGMRYYLLSKKWGGKHLAPPPSPPLPLNWHRCWLVQLWCRTPLPNHFLEKQYNSKQSELQNYCINCVKCPIIQWDDLGFYLYMYLLCILLWLLKCFLSTLSCCLVVHSLWGCCSTKTFWPGCTVFISACCRIVLLKMSVEIVRVSTYHTN